jgi:UDP-hydrolysing UDP-N-acetyl-D-glucosamine 2-epimerase
METNRFTPKWNKSDGSEKNRDEAMKVRRVAVFTGNRAEYGLQVPLLRAIEKNPNLDYLLMVSGAHLDPSFGNTLDEIRDDGFKIASEIEIKMDSSSLFANAQAIGSGILAISRALNKLKPDIMVVYADRFEGFAAVIAATQMNIPTAHIEGGDLTEGGALDDSVRHAMTKLSHMHFTTNQQATNRVLAMGEEAWRVHTVGLPAIDLILEGDFASEQEVKSSLNLDLSKPIVLFTQHSVSTEFDQANAQVLPSLAAIEHLSREGIQTIVTYPNNDAGAQDIITNLTAFERKKIKHVQIRKSLGRRLYHGVLALAKNPNIQIACAGNSSSGVKESPVFGCPTTNIGSRQKGRLQGGNIINVPYDQIQISEAIKKCLFDKSFREFCRSAQNPYGNGDAGRKIAAELSKVTLNTSLIRKQMTISGFDNQNNISP